MLTYLTRNKLAEFLLAVNEGERQIEIIRQILCEQEQFEPYAAFKRIDRHKKGAINAVDILRFLEDNKVHHSEACCHIFIHRYDADGDGQLVYSEFLQGVLTLDNTVLRTITTQRPNYDVAPNEYLPFDVEYALTKVINREIEFYLELDAKKEELLKFQDFSFANAFGVIDKYSSGVINYDNLRMFFKGQAIYPGDDEVIAILRRLDKNDDGLITFKEFAEAMEPVSDVLRSIANRRNITNEFASPTKKKEASPLRRTGSPSRRVDSPTNVDKSGNVTLDSPERRIRTASSPLRKEASPRRKEASPPGKVASPLLKEASPYRKEASPQRKEASPQRKEASAYKRINAELNSSTRTVSPTKVKSPTIQGEGTSSLRRSQIYKDFPKNQSRSPTRSGLDETAYTKKSLNISRSIIQTPEKRSSSRDQNSINRSVKKSLCFEENVNHYMLIQTLKQFIVLDKDLETAKQDLTLKSDFNLLDFFRTFDTINQGTITCREFENGLIKYGVYPNKEDLCLLFKKLDTDNDGLLRFSDFAETFTPKQKEYANLLHNRSPNNIEVGLEIYKVFSQDTKGKIVNVLKLHLENEGSSESLRQRLKQKGDMSGHDAFKYLDMKGDGFITADELIEIFQKNESFLTEREVKLLIERLDKDKDGKVSYYELAAELTPKSEQNF